MTRHGQWGKALRKQKGAEGRNSVWESANLTQKVRPHRLAGRHAPEEYSLFRHDVQHQRRTPPSPQHQRQHERQEKDRRPELHAGRSVCRGIGAVQVLDVVFFFFLPVPTFAISDIFGNCFGRPRQCHSFCYHRYQFNPPNPWQWQRKRHIDVGSPSQAIGVPSWLVSSRRTDDRMLRTTLRRKSPRRRRRCCCRTNKKNDAKAPPQTDRCVPVLLPRAVPRDLQARKQQTCRRWR